MASNEIKYRVDVDASRANRGLDKFGKAARDAGKDVANAFDDTATAGDKARAAIEAMAQAMDSELRDAAAAAEALAQALGPELTGRMDTSEVVADLNRMGVSFDEIRADADRFADTLRKVDGINMGQVNAGLGKTKAALDNVRGSSDQSRSVMANLSGNAAQSAFQNLGGNIGDVGVAIGQLAEYAVDGNVKVGNLVKLAGPMLGLAAATTVLTQAIGAIKAKDAFNAQLVDDFSDALREGNTVAETLMETVRETGDLNFETGLFGGAGILGISSKTRDLIPLFNQLGLNYEDFMRLLADPTGVDQLKAMKEEWLELALAAEDDATGDRFQANAEAARDAADGLEDYKNSSDLAAISQEELAVFLAATSRGLDDINSGFLQGRQALASQDYMWRRITDDLADNGEVGAGNVDMYNELQHQLGLNNDEMDELARQKVAEQLEAQADAARELAGEVQAVQRNVNEYNRVVGSAEFGRTHIEAAETAMGQFFKLVQGGADQVSDVEAAYDDLQSAVEAAGDEMNTLNLSTPEGRQLHDSLQALGQTLVPEIAEAFAASEGDIDAFGRDIDEISKRVLTRLTDEFGLSRAAAQNLLNELGLVPSNVETMYELLGTEDAKLKIGLLQGVIDDLDPVVQNEIAYAISIGDYQGALDAALAGAQAQANRNPVVVPFIADIGAIIAQIARLRRQASIPIKIYGQTASASAAPMTAAPTATAMVAPARAAPTAVTVNVNSAVIGSRFDIMRAVSAATRQGIRLGAR